MTPFGNTNVFSDQCSEFHIFRSTLMAKSQRFLKQVTLVPTVPATPTILRRFFRPFALHFVTSLDLVSIFNPILSRFGPAQDAARMQTGDGAATLSSDLLMERPVCFA